MIRILKNICSVAVAMILVTTQIPAHEIQENRAQLVLRDDTHIAMTLFVAYIEALHVVLAPQRSASEFLVMYSAMNPESLQKELVRAQTRLQSGTKLCLANGTQVPFTNWIWPDVRQVQAMMQQYLMQAMVDPAGHAHFEPLEVHADANSREAITAINIQFPQELRRVLVVSYRPSQVWVEANQSSSPIQFR
jgi:hypothetical protein